MDRRSFVKQSVIGAGALATRRLAGGAAVSRSVVEPWLTPEEAKAGSTYRRIKAYLDTVPMIDMHEHLPEFDQLLSFVETDKGRGVNLYGLWKASYVTRIDKLTPWKPGEKFVDWWEKGKHDFENVRAADFYRYMWLAFHDLYNVDFDHITDAQAADLDKRIFENYKDQKWLDHVIRKRSNIEIIVCDRYWKRFDFKADYPFEFLTFNVTTLVWAFHPSEYILDDRNFEVRSPLDDPYIYARKKNLPLASLDDFLSLLDHMFADAKKGDCVCLKTTLAYVRTLDFENVSKERAKHAFGRSRSELAEDDVKAFEDYIMWRLCELSAKYQLPFQIHTGDARIQGSNPMLLVPMIEGNPRTKFELFHGGYPWVRETGAIGNKFGPNVWINCVWLPAISYTTAKSAFHEWLEVMPSNRLTWGGDDVDAEGIYGEAELTRHCWAEVLAEKVERGELAEDDARQIGKQVLRDNALELYPRIKARTLEAAASEKR